VIRRKYYNAKRCTKMGRSKIAKNPMKTRVFLKIIYQRTKVQKLGSPKNERVEKT
jgi:hypothetical protein